MTDDWRLKQLAPENWKDPARGPVENSQRRTANGEHPMALPVAPEDDCGACQTNSPLVNPIDTKRISFDVALQIPSWAPTKFIVVYRWPSGMEAARVRVPEPTGMRAAWYQRTNGAQVWLDVQTFTNFTQVIHCELTNTGPMGFFVARGEN